MNSRRMSIVFLAIALLFSLFVFSASAKGETGAPLYQSPLPTPTPPLPRSAALTFTPPVPNPVLVGSEVVFEVGLSVANIIPGVTGAELYISYNPAFVQSPTSPGTPVAEVLPNFFGTSNVSVNEVLPAASCPGGAAPCVHLVVAGPAQVTKTGAVARLHFTGVAEGSACFGLLQSALVDADGYAVQHAAPAQVCATVQFRGTVTGTVLRQGVPANPNPGGGTYACASVTAVGATTIGPVNTSAIGAFSLGNLPIGTYTFRATYPGYLSSERTGVVIDGTVLTVSIDQTRLRGGDVNGDNVINILDVGQIIGKFGQTGAAVRSASATCTVTDEPADVNDDSIINISDLAIAAGNWNQVGPRSWAP